MAANRGWFYYHFEAEYFSPVWFAPADETGVPPEELREEYIGGGGHSGPSDNAREAEHWRQFDEELDREQDARLAEIKARMYRPDPPKDVAIQHVTERASPISDALTQKIEDQAASAEVPSLQDVETGIELTKRTLSSITSAAALRSRQRQDDEAAVMALFALAMLDDD